MPFPMSRRTFLLAGGSAVAVAACSSSGKSAPPTTPTTARPKWTLIGFYASDALAAGTKIRLPYGLAGPDGGFPATLPVSSLTFTVTDPSGASIPIPAPVPGLSQSLPRAYFPLEFTAPKAGVYTIKSDVQGTAVEASVQVGTGGTVPKAGGEMIPFDTPTTANLRGVKLLCTNNPPCPLHDVSLNEALAEKRPLAFLIATPKYCQVAVCGPVLDILLKVQGDFPQVRFLHSEVYPSDADAQPTVQNVVPVVQAYGLTYEPVLFLAGADGVVRTRLDSIYDASELRSALATIAS